MPDRSDVWSPSDSKGSEDQPFIQLPGPLKPPAAPATYKALTKIRLRVAPSRIADLVTSTEILPGNIFRAVESKEDEDGFLFLRADGEYENGWFLEKGIIGDFAGKPVVKRVAGSVKKQGGAAVLSMSEISRAEVVRLEESVENEKQKKANPEPTADTPQSRQQALKALLDDPQVREVCEKSGISVEALMENPEFLRAFSRRWFGEEVVG